MGSLAKEIDSNIAHYERAVRELPSANLSITLPILLIGLEPDRHTKIVDVRKCQFKTVSEITGKGQSKNRWRIVNGYLDGVAMKDIDENSEVGPMLDDDEDAEE
jgi:hypothetical protein